MPDYPEEHQVRVIEKPWSVAEVVKEVVDNGFHDEPFYVLNLGEVVKRYQYWKQLMPRVEPFYAVKCNDDILMVSTLAALGANFDCASKREIELVKSIGVESKRIIFAQPAKIPSHLRFAREVAVNTTVFDSDDELIKIEQLMPNANEHDKNDFKIGNILVLNQPSKILIYVAENTTVIDYDDELIKIEQLMPNAKLLIRIRCDDARAVMCLGVKFGCDLIKDAPRLLKLAAQLRLNVIGVSFHVGSGVADIDVYERGIKMCREVFSIGKAAGHKNMHLLVLGGGFPGDTDYALEPIADVINSALDTHFPKCSIRVIAEPGRYFAAAPYTLAAQVHSKKQIDGKNGETHTMYYLNTGVYGSLMNVVFENMILSPILINNEKTEPVSSSLWGPTCCSTDCVLTSALLPKIGLGEWMMFKDMGAYSMTCTTAFNGFAIPKRLAVVDKSLWSVLKNMHPLTESHFRLNEHLNDLD